MKTLTKIAVLFTFALHAAMVHAAVPATPGTFGAADAQVADGEVRRIDKDAKKITLRHGPIASLDMPPMTMVFQVKDPTMLDKVNTGDKIRFRAERLGGALTITELELAK